MQSILVTGASTGIGKLITQTLAQNNFFIYAGARKQKDLDDLDQLKNVKAVKLDVNDLDQIQHAVDFVRSQGKGLFGLVNNAGVSGLQPLVEIPEEDFDLQIQTNLYGPYRVTKAFSSLLIESKGRIVNTGSISGTGSPPLMGPYSMTKHAVEAFTDCLSIEMEEVGVSVSVIEPGNYDSDLGDPILKRMKQDPSKYLQTQFPKVKEYFTELLEKGFTGPQLSDAKPVAEAVLNALTALRPKLRYLVVPNQNEAEWTIQKALREVAQLNHDHAYSYSRKELIAMLDEVLLEQ